MTHQQLVDVRKYWLGRAIAFDSLRRQRQNDLVRMHLQLATTTTPQPKHKSALSQLLAILQWIFLFVFYLLRALISFFFGFLFIRVTVAKLVRGSIIESNNLVLILQAKQAIEETAKYLKEYLATANTFDGRDGSMMPSDVFTPFWRRFSNRPTRTVDELKRLLEPPSFSLPKKPVSQVIGLLRRRVEVKQPSSTRWSLTI